MSQPSSLSTTSRCPSTLLIVDEFLFLFFSFIDFYICLFLFVTITWTSIYSMSATRCIISFRKRSLWFASLFLQLISFYFLLARLKRFVLQEKRFTQCFYLVNYVIWKCYIHTIYFVIMKSSRAHSCQTIDSNEFNTERFLKYSVKIET